jgi:hypothetical protein
MNPSSIEGNTINSGADQLAFRLPLGGELYIGIKFNPSKNYGFMAYYFFLCL